jgi:hypothetical protein
MLRWVRDFCARFEACWAGFDRDLIGFDTPFGGFGGVQIDVSRIFAETLMNVKCFTARIVVPLLYG